MAASNIRTSLDDLMRQRDAIDEKLVEMNRLLRERDTLQRAIDGLEEVLKLGSGTPSELPLWQGARQVLFERDTPMSARQLAEALIATGWRLEGKTPIESLRTTLIRKPETFERLADGRFTLRRTILAGATSIADLGPYLSAAGKAVPVRYERNMGKRSLGSTDGGPRTEDAQQTPASSITSRGSNAKD